MSVKKLRQQYKEAYQTLKPQRPLLTLEDQERFLVPFGQNTLDELEQLLELMPPDSDKNKIVLSGHTGCGKSTLLAEFKQKISKDYCVIFFSIADFVPPSDLSHIVLLFVMILELLQEIRHNSELNIEAKIQEQMMNWLAISSGINLQEPIGFESSRREIEKEEWFLDAIIEQLKTSEFRERIEQVFKNRVSDLVIRLNRLSQEICQTKTLLLIVDDLDKIDLSTAHKLFNDNIKSLFETHCPAIFTVPISALRETHINASIRDESYDLVQMPTVKLLAKEVRRNPDPEIRKEPKEKLETILLKHINRDLFEPKTLDNLIIASGGVVRELIRLASACVFICFNILRRYSGDEEVQVLINEDILKQAKAKIWRDMSLALGNDEKEIIEYVYQDFEPRDPKDATFLSLLKGIYVIEYMNDDLWYDVHPIVAEGLNLNETD